MQARIAAHEINMSLVRRNIGTDKFLTSLQVSGAEASPDPKLAPVMAALQTVELQIDRIEQKEEKLESEKPEFWREDLRQLRREEEQLRRKKEQLRDEELLLLRN